MAFLPTRPNIDQLATEEFGEQSVPQQVVNAQEREDRILSSVENRLEKANYYRLVLENPLFSDGETAMAYEVEAEFRNFALERLQILMGERPERSEIDLPEEIADVLRTFSPLQLQATKLWAEKMIERDPTMVKAAPVAQPNMNQVGAPVTPPPALNVVKTEAKKPRRKAPKIEPRKPSLVAVAQQVRQPVIPQQPQPQVIQPRVPHRMAPPTSTQQIVAPAPIPVPQQSAAPAMPAPNEVIHHFHQQPVVPPPVAQPVQQVAPVQQAQASVAQPPVEQSNAESGAFVDPTGRTYEIREYVDHRTGELKQHKVYHQSQVMPKGDLISSGLYQKPNEKAAILSLAEKDTEGKVMVMRTGPNPWDKMGATTNLLGPSTIARFQAANSSVRED